MDWTWTQEEKERCTAHCKWLIDNHTRIDPSFFKASATVVVNLDELIDFLITRDESNWVTRLTLRFANDCTAEVDKENMPVFELQTPRHRWRRLNCGTVERWVNLEAVASASFLFDLNENCKYYVRLVWRGGKREEFSYSDGETLYKLLSAAARVDTPPEGMGSIPSSVCKDEALLPRGGFF